MDSAEFHSDIRSSAALLLELGILNVARDFGSLEPTEEFKQAARSRDSRYVDVYRLGLHQRSYNLILTDFSYFQFYFDSTKSPFGVRYAYYPNPFETAANDELLRAVEGLGSEGDGFEWYLQALEECDEVHRVPPLRFDISFDGYHELVHPTAHLHIGFHSENRWPVERCLGPLAFVMLVAKHYYGGQWAQGEDVGGGIPVNRFDRRFVEAKRRAQMLGVDYFSRHERGQIYVG